MKKTLLVFVLITFLIPYESFSQAQFETGKIGINLSNAGRLRIFAPTVATRQIDRSSILVGMDQTHTFDYYEDGELEDSAKLFTTPFSDFAEKNPKIGFIMETKITEFSGGEKLSSVKLENLKTGAVTEMNIDGVFIFIGYVPNTEKFEGIIELNDWKEIIVDSAMKTNLPGIFAAGDSIQKKYRQVTTAVADGTIAALSAADYINNLKKSPTKV